MRNKFKILFIVVLLLLAGPALTALGAVKTAKNKPADASKPATSNYINLSDYYLIPGQNFKVLGFNFKPNEQVTITAFGNNQTAIADNTGNITSASITVPDSALNTKATISAKGNASRNVVTAVLTVGGYNPTVVPSDYFLMPGGNIRFYGEGFAPNEPVALQQPNGTTILPNLTADKAGKFITGFITIPYKGSQQTYTFTGQNSKAVKKVSITAADAPAYLTLSNYEGLLGSRYRMTGFLFGANENINLTFQGESLGSTKTDSDGRFTAIGTVPIQAASGLQTITATGQSSGKTAQIKYLVNSTNYNFNNSTKY